MKNKNKNSHLPITLSEDKAKPPPIRRSKVATPVGQTLCSPLVDHPRPDDAMLGRFDFKNRLSIDKNYFETAEQQNHLVACFVYM